MGLRKHKNNLWRRERFLLPYCFLESNSALQFQLSHSFYKENSETKNLYPNPDVNHYFILTSWDLWSWRFHIEILWSWPDSNFLCIYRELKFIALSKYQLWESRWDSQKSRWIEPISTDNQPFGGIHSYLLRWQNRISEW